MLKGLLSLLILLHTQYLLAQVPQFRHYTVADGLASSTVYFAMQDSKGYMWFCTEGGVNRFDGHHFETFTIADGLADNENFKCFEDSKGRIWFFSYNGRLSYFLDTAFVNDRVDPSLRYDAKHGRYILDMNEDNEGNIWFSMYLGDIYKYDHRSVKKQSLQMLVNQALIKYGPDVNTIDLRDTGSYLRNLTRGSSSRLHVAKPRTRNIRYVSRQKMPDGDNYIITSAGLERIKQDSLYTELPVEKSQGLPSCFRIVGDDLWLSVSSGVLFLRGFRTKGFTGQHEKYLEGSTVYCIADDNEGGVWMATLSEGVFYLPGSQSYITNIRGNSLTAISHQQHSDLWAAGSYYGNLQLYSGNRMISEYKNSDIPASRVKVLKWLPGNKLLVGTDFNPYIYDLSTGRSSSVPGLTTELGAIDAQMGKAGLWLCGRSVIYLVAGSGLRLLYGDMYRPVSNRLTSIAEKDSTGCWFTTLSSLCWLQLPEGKVTEIAGAVLFKSNLRDIDLVNGCLWVATHGNGLFIFRDGKVIRQINAAKDDLTSDICQKIVFDGKDKVWIATNKGISIYDATTFRYLFRLTLNDILADNDIKDIDFNDDRAYVATPSGISIIDIRKVISATDPPAVYIRNLSTGSQTYNHLSKPAFRYAKGVVTLTYGAITFQANESVKYRYRISEADSNWNETRSNQVDFYDLVPGKYTFSVSAKKYNSGWSKPVSFSFTILPMWYQSLWLKALVAALLVSAVFLLYRLQVKRIRKRESEKTLYNKRITDLESKALTSQMNPHFIFNSMNTVQQFILRKEEEQGLNYLSDFSRLIRQMLQYSREPYIEISDELDFLRRYMELEQIRFSNKFSFSFQVDEDVLDNEIEIPPMLIQPLLENAVKHGLRPAGGLIEMTLSIADDMLLVQVDDNGYGINNVRSNLHHTKSGYESTALKVMESRLSLLSSGNGRKGKLVITDKKDLELQESGTRAMIYIPLTNTLHHDKSHNN